MGDDHLLPGQAIIDPHQRATRLVLACDYLHDPLLWFVSDCFQFGLEGFAFLRLQAASYLASGLFTAGLAVRYRDSALPCN